MNEQNEEQTKGFSLGEMISSIAREQLKEEWGNRVELNNADALLAISSTNFNQLIFDIRVELGIPELNADEDLSSGWVQIGNDETSVISSNWLDSQPTKVKRLFDKRIGEMIKKNNLAPNFYDWLFGYILYGVPFFKPLFNMELLYSAVNNVNELKDMGLNKEEKEWLKKRMRDILKMSEVGRPSKDKAKIYCRFVKGINSCKSKRRRFRVLETMLKTLKPAEGKTLTSNYGIIIDTDFPQESPDKERVLLGRFRKQRERAMKRFPKSKKQRK